jgi:multidrug efflux pump subunit AcrB
MRKLLLRPGSPKACLCLLLLVVEMAETLMAAVMGGLLTSTLLTLFVLPTLYNWFERDESAEVEV